MDNFNAPLYPSDMPTYLETMCNWNKIGVWGRKSCSEYGMWNFFNKKWIKNLKYNIAKAKEFIQALLIERFKGINTKLGNKRNLKRITGWYIS